MMSVKEKLFDLFKSRVGKNPAQTGVAPKEDFSKATRPMKTRTVLGRYEITTSHNDDDCSII